MKSTINTALTLILFSLVFGISTTIAGEKSSKQESLLQRIVDSYVDSSNTNETLKHLLDAKMYVSTAEHDLLVSRDKEGAQVDIENALAYLIEAENVAKPNIKNNISLLIPKLKNLEKKTLKEKLDDQDNQVDVLLKTAQEKLFDDGSYTFSCIKITKHTPLLLHDDLKNHHVKVGGCAFKTSI